MTTATDIKPATDTATPSVPAVPVALLADATPHRFSVAQYHAMIEGGIFGAHDRVELIEGWIVDMNPMGGPHRVAVQKIFAALAGVMPVGWHAAMQLPILLSNSEPEPDVTVVRGSIEDYVAGHPGPQQVALVVEVADTTLALDRTIKLGMYATAGIAQYWIVNLAERQVEIHAQPQPASSVAAATYAQKSVVPASGTLELKLDAGTITLAGADFFP